MEQERYSVLFSSQTGNTKILAQAIAQALPAAGCDYFGDYQGRVPSSPVLFVGFGPIRVRQMPPPWNC